MASSSRRVPTTPPNGAARFTSRLRFELFDEDERALLGSYAISSVLGVAFLLLIQFGPRVPVKIPVSFEPRWEPGEFVDVGTSGRSALGAEQGIRNGGGRRIGIREQLAQASATIGSAFAGAAASAVVGQTTNILGGVVVSRPGGLEAGGGGKAVLAYGEPGPGSIAPGRGGIGTSGSASEIGGVRGAGGVVRNEAKVSIPIAIPVDPLTPPGDAATVGTFVRGHESQLRFCYEENGLRANPALAGAVTVAITVASSGSVSSAAVTKRTWSGPGAAEAEACILRAIRGWRLPTAGAAPTTFNLPFNFSR